MRYIKIVIKFLLGILFTIILIALIIFLFLILMINKNYKPPLHQPSNQISRIDLLDTRYNQESLLYSVSGTETLEFMHHLESIRFHRYLDDPATSYGKLAVKIVYQNGYYDVIGISINGYYDATGKNFASDGWYHLAENNAFYELFLLYIDSNMLSWYN